MKRRWLVVPLAVATVIAGVAPGTASAQGEPGCFGQFVASFAQDPPPGFRNLGEEVSGFARAPGPFGRTLLPAFKAQACP